MGTRSNFRRVLNASSLDSPSTEGTDLSDQGLLLALSAKYVTPSINAQRNANRNKR
jgi:hypothetical protein